MKYVLESAEDALRDAVNLTDEPGYLLPGDVARLAPDLGGSFLPLAREIALLSETHSSTQQPDLCARLARFLFARDLMRSSMGWQRAPEGLVDAVGQTISALPEKDGSHPLRVSRGLIDNLLRQSGVAIDARSDAWITDQDYTSSAPALHVHLQAAEGMSITAAPYLDNLSLDLFY